MKFDVLLYAEGNCSDDALTFNNNYLPDYLAKELSSIKEINNIIFSYSDKYQGKLTELKRSFARKGNDDVAFWKELFSESEAEHIVKIYADSPFLDITIIDEMIKLHLEHLAEFTYSENLPTGFGCEIVSRDLITAIPEFNEKTLPLSKVIKSNINHFDIELYYKDPEIRDKRLSFRCGEKREKRILENISSINNSIPPYSEIKSIIEKNPEVLYTGPSYLEIEITGNCDLDCIFCYRNTLEPHHGDMEIQTFKKIISEMKSFNLPYTICLGGSGEPMMHPHIYEILEIIQNEELIPTVIIETNGIYLDNNFRNYLQKNKDHKIKLVININGYNSETYKAIHSQDSFDSVFDNISQLKEIIDPKENIYIQIMKINETESFLDRYYDFWDKLNIPIILQKQNTYLGKIEDRRYSDLSPLNRSSCWHLQRDLYILSDGTISFCKQDIDGQSKSGNINNDTLPDIWNSRKTDFINDYSGKLADNPNCKICDEWYTFNF